VRPLLDTNVLVDVALRRPGLHEASGAAVAWCLNNPGSGLLAVHSLATFSYLVERASGADKVREFLTELVDGMDIARLDNAEVKRALALPLADFEDALVAAAAESAAASHIVTRNTADFRRSPVKAVTPEDFMRLVSKV
jgi:predicted nucleic acid-binding protein